MKFLDTPPTDFNFIPLDSQLTLPHTIGPLLINKKNIFMISSSSPLLINDIFTVTCLINILLTEILEYYYKYSYSEMLGASWICACSTWLTSWWKSLHARVRIELHLVILVCLHCIHCDLVGRHWRGVIIVVDLGLLGRLTTKKPCRTVGCIPKRACLLPFPVA